MSLPRAGSFGRLGCQRSAKAIHTRPHTGFPALGNRVYARRMKLILKWLLSAAALLFVAFVYHGVEVKSFGVALIAAFVIGLFNVVVKPVLVVLTLPVTVVTLGLFLFIINALMFWAAAGILDGFHVIGFGAALLGSLIYSTIGLLIESVLSGLFPQE